MWNHQDRIIANPVVDYDLGFVVRKSAVVAILSFVAIYIFLTELLYGETIALKEIDNDTWEIYYSFYRLGKLDLRKNRIIKQWKSVTNVFVLKYNLCVCSYRCPPRCGYIAADEVKSTGRKVGIHTKWIVAIDEYITPSWWY